MRQITTREKTFLSVGVLAAVVIFVWFIMLPMLKSGGAEQKSSLEEIQERLAAVQKLTTIGPVLIGLEGDIREQSGYKKAKFKRGVASPAMIRYISQAAKEAGIEELNQLNAKLDTSRKSKTDVKPQKDILKSIVDQLYMKHVLDEVEQATEVADKDADENDPSDEQDDPDKSEEPSNTSEKPENEELNKEEPDKDNDSESVQVEESTDLDVSKEPETSEASENLEQVETKSPPVFPLIPKDMSHEVKKSLAEFIKERQGKTLELSDINEILENAGVEDASEIKRIKGRLQSHSKAVNQRKDEMVGWLGDVGISQTDIVSQRMSKYVIKMVFKSKIDQLVKFLYDLQDSARWLKFDSMRIGISERKETTLSVELSMTAMVLYGLDEE